jgi:glycosyltransferase involved in cell wall biosynthesis
MQQARDTPMRVCLVSYEFPPDVGGEASYAAGLARGLASLGVEVKILLPRKGVAYDAVPGCQILEAAWRGRRPFGVGSFLLQAHAAVSRMVERREIDVVHITFDYPSIPVPSPGVGVPQVVTVHHLHSLESPSGTGTLEKAASWARRAYLSFVEALLARQASMVVAVSGYTQKSVWKVLGVEPSKVRLIPNGIDEQKFSSATDRGRLRRRFGLGNSDVILYIGRLEEAKGLRTLVRAFSRTKKVVPGVMLLIVGSGPDAFVRALKGEVEALGVQESVRFAGRIESEEVPEAYALSRFLVLPSAMEGFGLSVLEAMMAGKPCVGTRVGALPELLVDGETGLLVGPGDEEGLSTAMSRLAGSREECEAMGAAGRRRASPYTVAGMAHETLRAYEEVTGRTRLDSVK